MSQKIRWTLAIAAALLVVGFGAPLTADSRNDAPTPAPKVPGVHPPVFNPEAPPLNDDFANAELIDGIPYTDAEDTTEATDEAGEPVASCSVAGNGVWYYYTNTSANLQSMAVNTYASDYDTHLNAFTGSWGALTEIACNDDSAGGGTGLQSAITFDIPAGTTVYVRAAGFAGDTGNLVFDVTSVVEYVCDPINIAGVLGSGSPDYPFVTGSQTGRLYRDGVSPTCADTKVCSIFDAAGSRVYDAYTFTNESEEIQCVTVSYTANGALCGSSGLFGVAYDGTFDPLSLCTNYITDGGSSSIGPGGLTQPMSFEIAPGASAVVVLHETNPGTNVGCDYTLTFLGNTCAAPVPNALEIPTLGRYGLAALAVLMLGGAVLFLRRRRHA